MDKKGIFQILFWYEVLLNVLLWIIYNPGCLYFGVYPWIGIVLFLLLGVPAILYMLLGRLHQNI